MLEILLAVGDVEERFTIFLKMGKDLKDLQRKFSSIKHEVVSIIQQNRKNLREELEFEIQHQSQLMERQLLDEYKEGLESKEWVPFGGYYEYDQFMWGLDAIHYLQTSLNILDFQIDITSWKDFIQKNEDRLKYIIKRAVNQLVLFKDVENPSFFPFDLYPEGFWWREVEWQTYQELTKHNNVR